MGAVDPPVNEVHVVVAGARRGVETNALVVLAAVVVAERRNARRGEGREVGGDHGAVRAHEVDADAGGGVRGDGPERRRAIPVDERREEQEARHRRAVRSVEDLRLRCLMGRRTRRAATHPCHGERRRGHAHDECVSRSTHRMVCLSAQMWMFPPWTPRSTGRRCRCAPPPLDGPRRRANRKWRFPDFQRRTARRGQKIVKRNQGLAGRAQGREEASGRLRCPLGGSTIAPRRILHDERRRTP